MQWVILCIGSDGICDAIGALQKLPRSLQFKYKRKETVDISALFEYKSVDGREKDGNSYPSEVKSNLHSYYVARSQFYNTHSTELNQNKITIGHRSYFDFQFCLYLFTMTLFYSIESMN